MYIYMTGVIAPATLYPGLVQFSQKIVLNFQILDNKTIVVAQFHIAVLSQKLWLSNWQEILMRQHYN